jgi:hypothetical protein
MFSEEGGVGTVWSGRGVVSSSVRRSRSSRRARGADLPDAGFVVRAAAARRGGVAGWRGVDGRTVRRVTGFLAAAAFGLAFGATFFFFAGAVFFFTADRRALPARVGVRPLLRRDAPPPEALFFPPRPDADFFVAAARGALGALFFDLARVRAGVAVLRLAMKRSFLTLTVWR